MKSAIGELAEKAKILSVTTRYFFKYTNSKKDKSNKEVLVAPEQAKLFYHACLASGLKVQWHFCDDDGACVEVTENDCPANHH